MMISTKGRYALRVMIDLAQHPNDGYISLKEIAKRQNVSLKYLEAIIALLNKAGMVDSLRGKEGGYKLSRKPEEYNIGSVLKVAEGSLAPVACVECEDITCEHADNCLTLPMWKKLDNLIDNYLESVSLRDILEHKVE